ncbi:MAG: hypothetical protein JNL08_03825 [Planctomycetes bacterium]|nr:hypothetical protein [Planctomycetota bacterium]
MTVLLARAVLGAAVATIAVGGGGLAWLALHGTVPDALLPLGAALGLAAAWRHRPPPPPGAPAPRAVTALGAALLLALAALLAYGALATPSRHWDGVVAWDLKANVLAAQPTLQQPFFRDPTVYCHSRDYPLLQPLLVALLERWGLPGRLWFPAAWCFAVAAVGIAARAAGHPGRIAWLFAVAAAVTPIWLSPTGGSFDSGYGDALCCAWLGGAACGLATGNHGLLAAATALLVLQKPEGLPYAGALLAAAWLRGDARALRAAVLATAAAGTLLLWLQHDLRTFGAGTDVLLLAPAAGAGAALLLAADALLRRRGAAPRWRWFGLTLLVPALVAALWLGGGGADGVVGAHFADPGRPLQRLDRLPRVLQAIGTWACGRGAFGLAFVVPLAIAVQLWWHGRTSRTPALGVWLVLAVPLWCVPFLWSPLDELDAHLRATLPRVLLHWTAAAWVWAAVQPTLGLEGRAALPTGPAEP